MNQEKSASKQVVGSILLLLAMLVAAGVFVMWDENTDVTPPPDLERLAEQSQQDGAAVFADSTDLPPVAPLDAATNDMAPDFTLPTLDGSPFHLAEHRGKVVVINFWATWCVPCRQEIPDLMAVQKTFGDDGLQIVGVSLDEEGAEVVRPYAQQMKINYPIALDDGEVADAFGGVYALPTTFVVNQDGRIYRQVTGMTTRDLLEPVVRQLLVHPAPAGD